MRKEELIEKYEYLNHDCFRRVDTSEVLKDLKQLDEPQKVVIPKYIADWYEEYKDNLEYNIWDWMKYNLEPKKRENVIFSRWLGKTANNPVETLVKMKLYGYTVEKEPKYTVKIKSVNQYLVRNTDEDFLGFLQSRLKSKFTRKELEEAGFGWVFDCPGIEIEEMEE
jgi:hypothetical protein